MHVLSVGTALPDHVHDQQTLIAAFERLWGREHHNVARVRRFHEAVQVGHRHLALPIERYEAMGGFGEANDAFLEVGTELAQRAITQALATAGLAPDAVDAVISTTVTGVATPSLEARVWHRMPGFRSDLVRMPLFGLGCVAGAAGLARVHDWLRGRPDGVVVLLSVELCSLTLQRKDLSIANLVASGLFGDGAAAVVCVGDEHPLAAGSPGPAVVGTTSRLYPDSERVMGWDVTDGGLRIVLDKSVPDVVLRYLGDDVDRFLATHGLVRSDLGSLIAHTGGPKVLQAMETALGLRPGPTGDLALSWRSLMEVGNLSSASVLFVLADTIAEARPDPGTAGLLAALGPGFGSELVLLRW